MRDHDISQRRACRLVGVDPKTVRRERPPDNPEIRAEMKAVAAKRRRFGYRRIGVMLERKGMIMNHSLRGPSPQWGGESPDNALSAVHRGEAGRPAATGPETGAWVADTDAGGHTAQS